MKNKKIILIISAFFLVFLFAQLCLAAITYTITPGAVSCLASCQPGTVYNSQLNVCIDPRCIPIPQDINDITFCSNDLLGVCTRIMTGSCTNYIYQKSCSPGQSCFIGYCRLSCTDSDLQDIFTKEMAYNSTSSMTDVCDSTGNIVEAYCAGSNVMNTTFTCPDNSGCNDGKCVYCNDTNPTNDPLLSGKVTDYKGQKFYDDCSVTTTDVKAYGCVQSGPTRGLSELISEPCPAGTFCPTPLNKCTHCYDSDQGLSDDGKNPKTFGFVQTILSSYPDECLYPSSVIEQYCKNGMIESEAIECPNGGKCIGGACSSSNPVQSAVSSIWFIRDITKSLNITGIAIEFQPHNFLFEKDVTRNFKIDGVTIPLNSNYQLFHYSGDSLLQQCTYTVDSQITEIVYPDQDKIIETEDVIYTIPAGAVLEPLNVTVKRLNFITCATDIQEEINKIISTQNSQNFKLVIGQSASPEDNIAAIDIAGSLKITNTIYDNQAYTNDSLIIIGGPCVNKKAAELLGLSYPTCETASTIPENKGMIRIFNHNGQTQILVAGWNALQTRIAAQDLVRFNEFKDKMNTNQIITYGTSLNDVHVE